MRVDVPRYPVDRYLVPSSNKFELVNIIDDDIWKSEPSLRPEDEIILRKLHEMLQMTAGDLKMLSGELARYHQPGVQVKSQPTPLDEEFNEKIHVEEVVNAKFHGHKIIDPSINTNSAPNAKHIDRLKSVLNLTPNPKVSTAVQATGSFKKTLNRKLSITQPKIIQIEGQNNKEIKTTKLNNSKVIVNKPTVAYNEFTFKYDEPKPNLNMTLQNNLQVQHMPSINIRSELVEQKVVQLDIVPEVKDKEDSNTNKNNIAVIAMEHETIPTTTRHIQIDSYPIISQLPRVNRQPIRKVSIMSACDSSASTNASSDTLHKQEIFKNIKATLKISPKNSARSDINAKKVSNKKTSVTKKSQSSLDEWKKKLNIVYGQPTTSKNNVAKSRKGSPKKSNLRSSGSSKPQPNLLNNAEYIPYSKLTLGGVNVSDIEKEISNIPDKAKISLSPVLDKILSSRENSFHDSPRKINKASPRVLTTSDENLLQEVLDIERTVSETISKNIKKSVPKKPHSTSESSENNDNESYADDFEDDKSNDSNNSKKNPNENNDVPDLKSNNDDVEGYENTSNDFDENNSDGNGTQNIQNKTYTKTNLSFKNSVDVFEFVHLVDTQDSATQSNTTRKISLKETQTSPVNDKSSIQPIHNDLWPSTSIDPKLEVENMFKLEKEFIKKLILDEYGDLLEKNLNKPSTSSDSNEAKDHKNVAAYQKNTQTSPAHVKNVMTSPTRTKTRTTSPFMSLRVDNQTSPMVVVTNEERLNIEIDDNEDGISVNLSSPRFSLRLPQTSREVMSNLEVFSLNHSKVNASTPKKDKVPKARVENSSSSLDGDKSSSEISSLGEVKWKLKRQLKKHYDVTMSETSSSSVLSSSNMPACGILPLRSEEESAGQTRIRTSKSEGETSLGQVLK